MADTSATLNEIDSRGLKLKLVDNGDSTYSLSTTAELTADSVEVQSEVEGRIADGSAAGATKPVQVGGVDGSGNAQRFLSDTDGHQQVDILAVADTAAAATLANVNDSASSVTLQASNAARKGWTCFNDSDQALLVKFGATASATSFTVKIAAGGYYEMPRPIYTGVIDGIWAADSTGAARVTELT